MKPLTFTITPKQHAAILAQAKRMEIPAEEIARLFQEHMSELTDDFHERFQDHINYSDFAYPDLATAMRVARREFEDEPGRVAHDAMGGIKAAREEG